jgi:hypothetical protein
LGEQRTEAVSASHSRQVKTDEGRSVAQKLGATFIETSAKDNKNVREYQDPNDFAVGIAQRSSLISGLVPSISSIAQNKSLTYS